MSTTTGKTISAILGAIGILMLIGMGLKVFPFPANYSIFVGITCFVVAALVRSLSGKEASGEPRSSRSERFDDPT
jgi:hypothetical protein